MNCNELRKTKSELLSPICKEKDKNVEREDRARGRGGGGGDGWHRKDVTPRSRRGWNSSVKGCEQLILKIYTSEDSKHTWPQGTSSSSGRVAAILNLNQN